MCGHLLAMGADEEGSPAEGRLAAQIEHFQKARLRALLNPCA